MSKLPEQSIAELTRPLMKAAREIGLEGANQLSLSLTDSGYVALLTRTLTDSDLESLGDGLLIGLALSQQSGKATVMQIHVKGPRFADLTPSLTDMDGIVIPKDQAQAYMTPTVTPDEHGMGQLLAAGAGPTIAAAGVGLAIAGIALAIIVVKTVEYVSEATGGGGSEGDDSKGGGDTKSGDPEGPPANP